MRLVLPRIPWLLLFLVLALSSVLVHGAQSFCATLAIAHRGNSIIAPENTIAAISATEAQAHIVEFDVRQCATGELVVIHDDTVDRTTDGTGRVADLPLAQLKSLDAGSWFSPEFINERIPTLAEALLSLPSNVKPLIHRYTGSAATYLAELEVLKVQGVIIQSFSWEFLATVRSMNDEIPLGYLGNGLFADEILDELRARITESDVVAWRSSGIDARTVQLIHEAGLALYVWTVNDITDIETFIARDVNGIISDDPASVFQRSMPWYLTGDFNADARVDLDDHPGFVGCFGGPGHPAQEGCVVLDFDCDGDLDLYDFSRLTNSF